MEEPAHEREAKDRAERLLYEYILDGNLDAVRLLIKDGQVNPDREFDGRRPIYIACEARCLPVINFLLHECKVEVNSKSFFEETALHLAVKSGDIEIVKAILEAGARINRADGDRIRPIHLAASMGRRDIIQLLLDNGAQLNPSKKRGGNTPLHCILLNDHMNLLSYLIESGANVNIQDEHGNSPLMIAAVRGLGIEVIEQLIKAGADVNLTNRKGRTALFACIYHDQNAEVAERLLDAGASYTIQDPYNDNYTLLHYACIHGQFSLVKRLIKMGLDSDAASLHNETPLYVSVKRGFTTIAKYLIKQGCNVNVVTTNAYDNSTPMHAAICYYTEFWEFMEIVDALIDAGAELDKPKNFDSTDRDFRPLVLLALMCQKFDFASYLIAVGCPIHNSTFVIGSALHRAFSIRHTDLIRQMFDAGVDVTGEVWIKAHMYSTTLHELFGVERLISQFMRVANTPRRLKDICRIGIRRALLAKGSWRLKHMVKKLPLCWGQKYFLMMEFNPN